jgi:hypothetical protein
VSKSAKRICESQEAVFELNERSEFSEKGDLQIACKASTIAIIFLSETKVSLRKILKIARE